MLIKDPTFKNWDSPKSLEYWRKVNCSVGSKEGYLTLQSKNRGEFKSIVQSFEILPSFQLPKKIKLGFKCIAEKPSISKVILYRIDGQYLATKKKKLKYQINSKDSTEEEDVYIEVNKLAPGIYKLELQVIADKTLLVKEVIDTSEVFNESI